jgi:hypothetical protein
VLLNKPQIKKIEISLAGSSNSLFLTTDLVYMHVYGIFMIVLLHFFSNICINVKVKGAGSVTRNNFMQFLNLWFNRI